jgi:hypothetical protein
MYGTWTFRTWHKVNCTTNSSKEVTKYELTLFRIEAVIWECRGNELAVNWIRYVFANRQIFNWFKEILCSQHRKNNEQFIDVLIKCSVLHITVMFLRWLVSAYLWAIIRTTYIREYVKEAIHIATICGRLYSFLNVFSYVDLIMDRQWAATGYLISVTVLCIRKNE